MSKKKLSKDYGLSTMPGLMLREKYLTKKSKKLTKAEHNPFQTEADVDKYLKQGKFALLTGHKKDTLSPEASDRQHNDLIADLEASGHRWQHVGGKWLGNEAEPTVMVHDISPEDATHLARKYSQTAHIQSNAGAHKELSHQEGHNPPEGGTGHIIGNHLKDNYSEITLPNKQKVRFSLNVGYPMPELNKTENLEKGLKGDWKKEGYKISHIKNKNGITVQAHHKNGELAGEVDFIHQGKNLYPDHTEVKEPHQRKGIATGMYHYAMKVTNKKIARPGYHDQTEEARAFWDENPHRTNVNKSLNKTDEYDFYEDSPEGFWPEDEAVKVTPNSSRLRALRTHLESLPGGQANKKDIEAAGHDLKALGVSHLLDGKGNLHHNKVTQHIDSMPKMVYGVTHDTYGEDLDLPNKDKEYDPSGETEPYNQALEEQRHSTNASKVFQLNYTPDHEKKMKDAGVFNTFQKMVEASKHSRHPVGDRTLGWVRYTSDDDGHHIDEIQSDFGQSFVKQGAAQIKQAMRPEGFNANGQIIRMSPEEGARHLETLKAKYPDEHFNKISEILFGGKHPNEVVHEAFLQHLRNKGDAGKQVHIWDAEPKGEISGQSRMSALPAHMQLTYKQSLPKLGYKPGGKYGQLKTQHNPTLKGKTTHTQKLVKKELVLLPAKSGDYFKNLLSKSEQLNKSKNVREQKKKLFGTTGEPQTTSKEGKKFHQKQSEAVAKLAEKRYKTPLLESKGKFWDLGRINKQRIKENQPALTIDEISSSPDYEPSADKTLFRPKKQKANPKPDWRSGELESQRHIGAKIHEMAHLEEMPEGKTLPEMQEQMDEGSAMAASKYKGAAKQTEMEIIPMAMENPLRRRAGIPAFGRPQKTDPRIGMSTKPLTEDSPERVSLDTGRKYATRLKDEKGNLVDLVAQSKNITPEMKQRMEQVDTGELVFDKEKGWSPGTSIDAKINRRARLAQEKGPNSYFHSLLKKPEKLAASEKPMKNNYFKNLIKKQKLSGGKGDFKPLSSFDPKEVEMGIKVEMEHTKDEKIAKEIVADHLTEDPKYYSKLKEANLADELKKKDPLAAELTPEKGVSVSGIEARRADPRQKGVISHGYGRIADPEKHKERAKNYFRHTLERLKAQPKPNLPKSEEPMEKEDKPFHGYNKNKHSKEGGLNDKYREKINREEGSNLKRPVTGDVKPGSKAAKRRKSFCARMSGVKGPTSKEGKLTPKGAALKRWKCSKEEKEMEKRCWEGYEPTPGKKPYSKGSCRPVKKTEELEKGAPKLQFQPIKVAGVDLPSELHEHWHSNQIVPYDHEHREKAAKFVADVWKKNRFEGERMSTKLLGIGQGGKALVPKATKETL